MKAGSGMHDGELERWSIRVLVGGVVLIQALLVFGLIAFALATLAKGVPDADGQQGVSSLVIKAGLWVLALLPAARVITNVAALVRLRELKLVAVALGVLVVIALAFVDYGVM